MREPEYYSLQMLKEKIRVPYNRLIMDLLAETIKKYAFQNMNRNTLATSKKRITTLLPILNQYARDHLHEGPVNIIFPNVTVRKNITEGQKQALDDNIESDGIFKLWLNEFGININHIKIVIPKDEVQRYESYLFDTSPPTTLAEEENTFDVNAYISNIRASIDCKRNSCVNCKKIECRKGIANYLSTNYGYHTKYGNGLCTIGVAMGLPEPPRIEKEDSKDTKEYKQKKIDIVKSQVKRWQKEDPDKESRRHSPFPKNHTSTSHRNVKK